LLRQEVCISWRRSSLYEIKRSSGTSQGPGHLFFARNERKTLGRDVLAFAERDEVIGTLKLAF